MRRIDARAEAAEAVAHRLRRPWLGAVEPSPAVAARTAAVFGRPITPMAAVQEIVDSIAAGRSDAVLLEWVRRIDRVDLGPERLFVSNEEIAAARAGLPAELRDAMEQAARHIRLYHQSVARPGWLTPTDSGALIGQRVTPLDRVGIYVPAGRAPLISTALMAIIPAAVAGVREVIVATPCRADGEVDPLLLAACDFAGAHRILRVGGAHAVAALAYGTETVPAVDKIVGPGNLFVQLAKRAVFGQVGIDGLEGPSEIAVLADATADAAWVASDLVSQAEHEPDAAAVLITPAPELIDAVEAAVAAELSDLPRREVAAEAFARWGAAILCRDLAQGIELVNALAPEHLEIVTEDPWSLLPHVRHAGAIFLGPWATVPFGDYIAGPPHVLPTNGAARFASPLTVDDFVKRSSVIAYGAAAARCDGPAAIHLATAEGLLGHARAIKRRLSDGGESDGDGRAAGSDD
ncbi:MAG TPA: histidinol dehydrogenase [Limnochordia bacterium]